MKRSETALVALIVFFIAWVLISIIQPLAGLFILGTVFAVLLGFFILLIAGLVDTRRK